MMRKELKDESITINKEEQTRAEPITYGDIFSVSGEVEKEPITVKDAALMQSAETRAVGRSHKGSAAAIMQSAAEINERFGLVDRNRETIAAAEGMAVIETQVPGQVVCTEFVAGQPVHSEIKPVSTQHSVAAIDAITIGQALAAAAMKKGDKPIDSNDARAIQCAEKRATGNPLAQKGGLAATAQAAAELNPRVNDVGKTTLSNILLAASEDLPADKAVTTEDAEKIMETEARGSPYGHPQSGGIGETMQAAAKLNEKLGITPAVPYYTSEDALLIDRLKSMAEK